MIIDDLPNGNQPEPRPRRSMLRKIADSYQQTDVAYFFGAMQPLGVLLAVIALGLTAISVIISGMSVMLALDEVAEGRKVRNLGLLNSLTKELVEARETDAGRSATYRYERRERQWKCNRRSKQLQARVGQIISLEHMNDLGISLRDLDANEVNLSKGRRTRSSRAPGIDLAGAGLVAADLRRSNLWGANLNGANLLNAHLDRSCLERASFVSADLSDASVTGADLYRANLTGAILVGARLSYSRFARVDFSGADLLNADVTGANFRGADNLAQSQIDLACADPGREEPMFSAGLEWKPRRCAE